MSTDRASSGDLLAMYRRLERMIADSYEIGRLSGVDVSELVAEIKDVRGRVRDRIGQAFVDEAGSG